MKKVKVSVIIPVYNVEKYLKRCLDSIVNQTLKDIEIIIVNDGSTDNSKKICEKYLNNDKRIRLINQANKGVSVARNNGIVNSNGEYIIFIDADDYCENNMFEELLKLACFNKNSLVVCGYYKVFKNNKICVLSNESETINKNKIYEKILTTEEVGGYLWNKIFKASIIKDNNIKFNTKVNYCEDILFVNEYVKKIKDIKYIVIPLYYYRMRKNSATNNFISEKNIGILDAYSLLCNLYCDKEFIKKIKYEYLKSYYKLKNVIPSDYILRDDIIQNQSRIIKENNLSLKELILFYIIKYFRNIYIILKKRKNKHLDLFE